MRLPRRTVAALGVVLSSACAIGGGTTDLSGPVDRTAVDTPVAFTFPNGSGIPSTCTSPATDPRTRAEYRFVRAARGIADYEVPEGRYGVRAGELLRIDCATGRALGIVRR